MAQISLAWVMAKDGELRMQYIFADIQIDAWPSVGISAPIVGTTSLDKLKDLLGAYINLNLPLVSF